MKRPIQIGLAIAGTIIGAGFATGKELLVFFNGGSFFYVILMIISLVIVAVTTAIYFTGAKKSGVSTILTIVFTSFSGGCYAIMLACGGQTLYDSVNISYQTGIIITYIVTILIIKFGIEGVYKFNAIATPLIAISLIFISFVGLSTPVFNNFSAENFFSPYINAFLYAGYNILAVLPFISAISKETTKKDGFSGIAFGFLIVLLTSITIKLLLNNYFSLISRESIPILKIIGILNPYLSYIYSVVLYGAIVTTAVNLLFILTREKGTKSIFLISLPLLLISFLGFTTLLEKIYTYFGYAGIVIILVIIGREANIIKHKIKRRITPWKPRKTPSRI